MNRGAARARGGRGGRGRGRGGASSAKSMGAVWKQPVEVANELDEGEVRAGLDGTSKWKVVCLRATGNHRWYRIFPKPFASKAGQPPAAENGDGDGDQSND